MIERWHVARLLTIITLAFAGLVGASDQHAPGAKVETVSPQHKKTATSTLILPRPKAQDGTKTDLVVELRSGKKWNGAVKNSKSGNVYDFKKGSPERDVIIVSGGAGKVRLFEKASLRMDQPPEIVEWLLIEGDFVVDSSLEITGNEMAGGEWDGKKWGAIHKILGQVKMFEYEFDSNSEDPLMFKVKKEGYEYVKGAGTVKDSRTGMVHVLQK